MLSSQENEIRKNGRKKLPKIQKCFLIIASYQSLEVCCCRQPDAVQNLGVCFGIFGYIKGTPLRVRMVTVIVKELPDLNI
jgi:hypothetical protein